MDKLVNAIKAYENGSSKLSAWTLSIIAGSLLVIINSDFISPPKLCFRLIYLLIYFGLIFLSISLNHGFKLTRSVMVVDLHEKNEGSIKEVLKNVNEAFNMQLKSFKTGMFFFVLWISAYLFWWIFIRI